MTRPAGTAAPADRLRNGGFGNRYSNRSTADAGSGSPARPSASSPARGCRNRMKARSGFTLIAPMKEETRASPARPGSNASAGGNSG